MPKWQRWKGIMKCVPFEEKRLAKWNPPYIVQPKYDGDRCKAYPLDNGYLPVTSEENPYFSIPHIVKSLVNSQLNITLDGELYDHKVYLEGGHDLIHSIVSRTVNIHPRFREIKYHVFDVETDEPQMMRLLKLEEIKKLHLPHIEIAPFWICETLDEIKNVYDLLIHQHYEGVVIRHFHNAYERKRSTLVMKFKPKKHDTYTIIGWNEETTMSGEPKGRIGSLILASHSGDSFAVGAGLNADEKAKLWALRDKLPGLQAIVHYQHLTNKGIPRGTLDIEVLWDEPDKETTENHI